MKCIFMLLKPDWTLLAVYVQTVILKNCITVRKQHLDHRIHRVTYNVHTVIGRNLTIQGNSRTSRILLYCCPYHHRSASMFHLRIIGFLGHFPDINPAWCCEQHDGYHHLTILHISNHQMSRFYDHHTIFSLFSVVFSNKRFSNCSSCEALVKLFLWKKGLQDKYRVLLSPLLQ